MGQINTGNQSSCGDTKASEFQSILNNFDTLLERSNRASLGIQSKLNHLGSYQCNMKTSECEEPRCEPEKNPSILTQLRYKLENLDKIVGRLESSDTELGQYV